MGLALGLSTGCLQVIGDIDVTGGEDPIVETGTVRPPPCTDAGTDPVGCSVSCQPGKHRCNREVLEVCKPTGAGWDYVQQCESPGLCDAEKGACQLPVCRPLEYECSTTGELRICNADLTGFEGVAQCESFAFCSAVRGQERCVGATCNLGDRRCNGAQLEECRADRMGYNPVMSCVSAALCSQDAPARAHCIEPACDTGEYSCNVRELRVCNADRSNWTVLERCMSAPLCNMAMKRCDPLACAFGQQRCVNGVLQRCNDDFTDYTTVANCGNPLLCDTRVMTCLTMPAPTPDPGSTPPPVVPASGAAGAPPQ